MCNYSLELCILHSKSKCVTFDVDSIKSGCRVNPSPGQVSLQDMAVDVLSDHALAGGSQNQNAGFAAWFYVTVLLQLARPFKQESKRTRTRYAEQFSTKLCQLICEQALLARLNADELRSRPAAACSCMAHTFSVQKPFGLPWDEFACMPNDVVQFSDVMWMIVNIAGCYGPQVAEHTA